MRRRTNLAGLALACILGRTASAAELPADAAPNAGFGERGDLVLAVERLIPVVAVERTTGDDPRVGSVTTTSFGASADAAPRTVERLGRIAFDAAFLRRVTAGASVFASRILFRRYTDETGTLLGVAPRLGYVAPLGRSWALWPRAGTQLSWRKFGDIGASSRQTRWHATAELVLAWFPVRHAALTLTPTAMVPLGGSSILIESSAGSGGPSRYAGTKDPTTSWALGLFLGLMGHL
jgi:hypothetical protein